MLSVAAGTPNATRMRSLGMNSARSSPGGIGFLGLGGEIIAIQGQIEFLLISCARTLAGPVHEVVQAMRLAPGLKMGAHLFVAIARSKGRARHGGEGNTFTRSSVHIHDDERIAQAGH
jgi:hypothetical protein